MLKFQNAEVAQEAGNQYYAQNIQGISTAADSLERIDVTQRAVMGLNGPKLVPNH